MHKVCGASLTSYNLFHDSSACLYCNPACRRNFLSFLRFMWHDNKIKRLDTPLQASLAPFQKIDFSHARAPLFSVPSKAHYKTNKNAISLSSCHLPSSYTLSYNSLATSFLKESLSIKEKKKRLTWKQSNYIYTFIQWVIVSIYKEKKQNIVTLLSC